MIRFKRSNVFLPLSIIIDSLCINFSFLLAFFLKFKQIDSLFIPPYEVMFWIFNSAWFLLLLFFKPYNEPRISFNIYKLIYNFVLLILIHAAFVSFFWVFSKGFGYSRVHLALTYAIAFVIGSFFRLIGLYLLKKLREIGYNNRNFIVVGFGELSSSIVKYYEKYPAMGYSFNGYFGRAEAKNKSDFILEIKQCLIENKIDCIYCCVPYLDNQQISEVINISEINNVQVKLLMDFRGFSDKAVSVEYHDFLPVINVSAAPFMDFKTAIIKRAFDLGVSSVIMVLGSPVFLFVALITKLTSKGSVFYLSERIGLWGKPFFMYKFRSMYASNSSAKHIVLSTGEDDPRITPWGKIMRKTRLDELPQFINVFLGHMSIVGPRPGIPRFNREVIKIAPEFERLLTIKPGVTSLGQIYYGYAETTEEMVDRMRIDLEYLKKYSVRTDIKLVFKTAKVMLQGKGQ